MTYAQTILAQRAAEGRDIGTVDDADVAAFLADAAGATSDQLLTARNQIIAASLVGNQIERGANGQISRATLAAIVDALDATLVATA